MKVRKVNRYTCEFCGKSNCSASSISKHEKRCTLNPNRECGMCKLIQECETIHVPDIVKMLPPESEYYIDSSYYKEDILNKKVLPIIRAATECPACTLAVLRQAHIPVPAVTDFRFKDECAEVWDSINEANREHDNKYVLYE